MLNLVHQDMPRSLHRSKEAVTPSCKALRTLNLSQQNTDLHASPGRQEFVWTSAHSASAASTPPHPKACTLVEDLVGMIISPAVLKGLKELGPVQLLLPITVPADPFAKSKSQHSQPLCSTASQRSIQQPFLSAPYAWKKVCVGFLTSKPPS